MPYTLDPGTQIPSGGAPGGPAATAAGGAVQDCHHARQAHCALPAAGREHTGTITQVLAKGIHVYLFAFEKGIWQTALILQGLCLYHC